MIDIILSLLPWRLLLCIAFCWFASSLIAAGVFHLVLTFNRNHYR